MYKFNFLNKINLEKQEIKKRNRFIKLVFISATSCLILLLIVLFLQSLSIGSNYEDALNYQKKITEKSAAFREKDFFKFKNIENIYNSTVKRKNITSILNAVESSLDSSLILDNLKIDDVAIEIRFVSRTSSSKSELMTKMNSLKTNINEKLMSLKYIDEKKQVDLLRGPDIKKSYDEFQYWVFDFKGDFVTKKPEAVKSAGEAPELKL
ncbi:MAG TPA: hypothetical protein PLK90_02465 [Clostridiales bacterium]|jgi:hypothetical protein|nr:hypothetical protein [Clostridiales bacterium]HQP69241.1 hypothetical protein [Clostridiales bacterium]